MKPLSAILLFFLSLPALVGCRALRSEDSTSVANAWAVPLTPLPGAEATAGSAPGEWAVYQNHNSDPTSPTQMADLQLPPTRTPNRTPVAPQAQRLSELAVLAFPETPAGALEKHFIALPESELSWAQRSYYDWLTDGQVAADFLAAAELTWEVAGSDANWSQCGCGFVFRLNARGDHYLIYLGLDGHVYLYRNLEGSQVLLADWYAGPVDIPAGEGELALAARGGQLCAWVEGLELGCVEDEMLASGLFGYAVASGTNREYGVRCAYRSAGLWLSKSAATSRFFLPGEEGANP